jgi:hypothetical protein
LLGLELSSRLFAECKYFKLPEFGSMLNKRLSNSRASNSSRNSFSESLVSGLQLRSDGCYILRPPKSEDQTNSNNCEIISISNEPKPGELVVDHFKQLLNMRGKRSQHSFTKVKGKENVYECVNTNVHDSTLTDITYLELLSHWSHAKDYIVEDDVMSIGSGTTNIKSNFLAVPSTTESFTPKNECGHADVIRLLTFQVRPKEFLSTSVRVYEFSNIPIDDSFSLYFDNRKM